MRILITGGLGFIGSNLATKLSILGHDIVIVDNLNPLYGGNKYNLHEANNKNIELIIGDVKDKELMLKLTKDVDIIFHFAAQVSYIDSLNMVYDDVDTNVLSTLNILESIKNMDKKPIVVFSSSRLVYGKINGLIDENYPTNPISIYGINKLTSERYIQTYHKNFGIPYIILRLTNPYGMKQQMKHSKYSIIGWFIRQAMENKTITVFGDGTQKRDYIYIDDVIDSILLLISKEEYKNKIYNVGSNISIEFREMIEKIIKITGRGKMIFTNWPEDYENIESGTIDIDISKLFSIGWKPKNDLSLGISKTLEFYKSNKNYYFYE